MKDVRRRRGGGGTQVGAVSLDTRKVQPLADLIEPPHRFYKASGTAGTKVSKATAAANADIVVGGLESERAEEQAPKADIYQDQDPRDVEAIEHLKDHHPRGFEHGASHLRSSEVKEYCLTFSSSDWDEVHRRVLLLGMRTAKESRAAAERKRLAMDKCNVFHPHANRLRSEAQLAIQLRRELQYNTLELAILEEMLRIERQKHISSRQRDNLELSNAFNKSSKSKSAAAAAAAAAAGEQRKQQEQNRAGDTTQKEGDQTKEDEDERQDGDLQQEQFQEGRVLSFEEYRDTRKKKQSHAVKDPLCMPIDDFVRHRFLGASHKMRKLRKPQRHTLIGEQHRRRPLAAEDAQDKKERTKEGSSSSEDSSSDSDYSDFSASDEEGEDRVEAATATTTLLNKSSDPQPATPASTRTKRRKRQRRRTVLGENQQPAYFYVLYEIFETLEMTPQNQLDFVIKYSDPANAMQMLDACQDWQETARVVALYERCVQVHEWARARKVDASDAFSESEIKSLERLDCFISMAQMFGSTCAKWVGAIMEKLGVLCEAKVRQLEERWEDTLRFRGHSYYKTRFSSHLDKSKPPKPLKCCGNALMVRLGALLLRCDSR